MLIQNLQLHRKVMKILQNKVKLAKASIEARQVLMHVSKKLASNITNGTRES